MGRAGGISVVDWTNRKEVYGALVLAFVGAALLAASAVAFVLAASAGGFPTSTFR